MSNELTVLGIVKKYLVENGFDGLRTEDGECGCELGDLAPCGEIGERCMAGVKGPALYQNGVAGWGIFSRERAASDREHLEEHAT